MKQGCIPRFETLRGYQPRDGGVQVADLGGRLGRLPVLLAEGRLHPLALGRILLELLPLHVLLHRQARDLDPHGLARHLRSETRGEGRR